MQRKRQSSTGSTMAEVSGEKTNQSQYLWKYLSLVILVIQNASHVLSMRYSRVSVESSDLYFTTTVIVLAEVLKMTICLIIIYCQMDCSFSAYFNHLAQSIVVNWKDTLRMSVPAIVYMVQTNMLYYALSNLEAAVYQVTAQVKILTTALFSVLMLNKKLSAIQWGSLVLLFTGVALVQYQSTSSLVSQSSQRQDHITGLLAVLFASLCSGFAGVYFEKMLKGSSTSIWIRNVQLGIFAPFAALIGMWVKDGAAVYEKGFFFGYTPLVYFVVVQQAIGGLIVAVVVRYADNILKGFATSLSIILSSIISVFLFNFSITTMFSIGTSLVLVAVYLYGRPSPQAVSKPEADEPPSPPPTEPVKT